MVYSTEAHRNKSTTDTEPYADTASPEAGAPGYYNISQKPQARNTDCENNPDQPQSNTQGTKDYEDIATGYEELKRVEYENTKKGVEKKVYAGLGND